MQVELLYTTTEYSGKKPHTEYSIKVSNESLQWMIRKRFSGSTVGKYRFKNCYLIGAMYVDFVALRYALAQQDHNECDYISTVRLPALPSRLVSYSTSMKDDTVCQRAAKLSEFMTKLVDLTKDCPNRHGSLLRALALRIILLMWYTVLSFFGAVSTSLNDVNTLMVRNWELYSLLWRCA
jgi:hypothetical protein